LLSTECHLKPIRNDGWLSPSGKSQDHIVFFVDDFSSNFTDNFIATEDLTSNAVVDIDDESVFTELAPEAGREEFQVQISNEDEMIPPRPLLQRVHYSDARSQV
jgi:hypothetical protein